jgi:hypothetical protein
MKDYCTWFPEYWFNTYIGDCCEEHDENCSTHMFYKCLKKKLNLFSSLFITLGGGIGCWAKYTTKMFKKLY